VRELNTALQKVLNPTRPGQPAVERFGWRFHIGDKVIQTENDCDKDVFNGDVGIVERIDAVEQQVAVRFDERLVKYDFGELDEISLAYAITLHKSQGSEFPAVMIQLATQHYMLLQRNLIYTGITRRKKLVVLIGQKKALGIAVRNDRPQRRYSGLLASLKGHRGKCLRIENLQPIEGGIVIRRREHLEMPMRIFAQHEPLTDAELAVQVIHAVL
jgi:exodeoxyribonuclease V alpha subunit